MCVTAFYFSGKSRDHPHREEKMIMLETPVLTSIFPFLVVLDTPCSIHTQTVFPQTKWHNSTTGIKRKLLRQCSVKTCSRNIPWVSKPLHASWSSMKIIPRISSWCQQGPPTCWQITVPILLWGLCPWVGSCQLYFLVLVMFCFWGLLSVTPRSSWWSSTVFISVNNHQCILGSWYRYLLSGHLLCHYLVSPLIHGFHQCLSVINLWISATSLVVSCILSRTPPVPYTSTSI